MSRAEQRQCLVCMPRGHVQLGAENQKWHKLQTVDQLRHTLIIDNEKESAHAKFQTQSKDQNQIQHP